MMKIASLGAAESRKVLTTLSEYGRAVFENDIAPEILPEDIGRFVAINLLTHHFYVDDDKFNACRRLRDFEEKGEIVVIKAVLPSKALTDYSI